MYKNNITYIIQTVRWRKVRGRRRAQKAIPTTLRNILPMWVYESIVADDRVRENGYHCTRSCRRIYRYDDNVCDDRYKPSTIESLGTSCVCIGRGFIRNRPTGYIIIFAQLHTRTATLAAGV